MTGVVGRADAFVVNRFIAQSRRPGWLDAVPLAALPVTHRALLVTDGTVSTVLEAQALEPVVVDCLEMIEMPAPDDERSAWLADPGETVVRRRAVIRGEWSGRVYTLAESWLSPRRLPNDFRRRPAGGRPDRRRPARAAAGRDRPRRDRTAGPGGAGRCPAGHPSCRARAGTAALACRGGSGQAGMGVAPISPASARMRSAT